MSQSYIYELISWTLFLLFFWNNYTQDAYSKPDLHTGLKHMFLTRVLVGRTCTGTSTLQRPPPGVHSAINGSNVNTARVFVTFDIAQTVGQYHVTFKK